jgi:anthranilate phosphoribosyltransferase
MNEFDAILDQQRTPADLKTFLIDLAARGETIDDILGAVLSLQQRMVKISSPSGTIDCCGTGGDGSHSLNISTAVSFVVAGAGVPVAKHGNRSASSKSGAADVLEALGININVTPRQNERALHEIGFCFLMAPYYHPALKHIAPIRKDIGTRTIFNLVGPLLNPASPTRQLIGVFDQKWMEPFAQVLKQMGTERAMIVNSHDGLDEISLSAPTEMVELYNGTVIRKIISSEDFDLPAIKKTDIAGGDADYNANALMQLLNGYESAYRNVVLANAAACLYLSGRVQNFKDGVDIARQSIDDGKALKIFDSYREFVKPA